MRLDIPLLEKRVKHFQLGFLALDDLAVDVQLEQVQFMARLTPAEEAY